MFVGRVTLFACMRVRQSDFGWYHCAPTTSLNRTRVRPIAIDPDHLRPSHVWIHFWIGRQANGLSDPSTVALSACCKFAFATHACRCHYVHDMTVPRLPCTGFMHVHAVIKGEYRFIIVVFIILTRRMTLSPCGVVVFHFLCCPILFIVYMKRSSTIVICRLCINDWQQHVTRMLHIQHSDFLFITYKFYSNGCHYFF